MLKYIKSNINKRGKIKMRKFFKTILFSLILIFTFVSCSTLHTVVSKRNLDVQTKMSDTIWLEPAAANERTVFVQIRNTSGKNLNIEQKITNVLTSKGYRIVNNPAEAKYWLQANILKVDKVNLDSDNGFSDVSISSVKLSKSTRSLAVKTIFFNVHTFSSFSRSAASAMNNSLT